MKTTKIFFNTLILTSLTSLGFASSLNNNTHFVTHKDTKNLTRTNLAGAFEQVNSASMDDYGPKPSNPNLWRDLRFKITMTKEMYNYFALILKETGQKNFVRKFMGTQVPYMYESWKSTQQEMVQTCKIASNKRHLGDNYFFNLIVTWLNSEDGWNIFKQVFTGENLNNNTYRIPHGYKTEQAQKQFRGNGVIMQFNFVPINATQSEWKLDYNTVKIFPYIADVIGLLYYYQDSVVKGGQVVQTPPLMDLKLPQTPTKEEKVDDLFIEIRDLLKYNFNLPQVIANQHLVAISLDQMDKFVSLDWKNPTIINIAFFKQTKKHIFYIYKPIRLYASGPT